MHLSKDWLGKIVELVMDRPLGSKHPQYGYRYPVNYGYIPNTISGDDMEIDAYVLKQTKSLETFHGQVVAIIHRRDDNEDKLIVIAKNQDITTAEIIEAIEFQEKYFDSAVIR